MRRQIWAVIAWLAMAATPAVAWDEPAVRPMPAELVQPRAGLGHVLAKLRASQPVRIAYLGGSITAYPGWRVLSLQWFQSEFPRATVSEIPAAIGGTGSDLGVFRLESDVLRYAPDLVFVEFAVNDASAPPRQIWRCMEGIVRQTWTRLAATDICFVYTFLVGFESDLRAGRCPAAAAAMEQVAAHYGVPSINVALKIVELERAGKLVFRSDQPPAHGAVRFSTDGVHPLIEGHKIYADVIAAGVREISRISTPARHDLSLRTPFIADHWQAAKQVPVTQAMLSAEWRSVDLSSAPFAFFRDQLGAIWETTRPGSKLSFKFRGSLAKLYDLMGPDGGQVIVTVDGKTAPHPIPRFDSFCTGYRLSTLPIAEGLDPSAVHSVVLEVHADQPDRTPVSVHLKNPEQELKSIKYQGTKLWAGRLLLLGDLADQ